MSAVQQQADQGTNWVSTAKSVAQTVGIFMFVNFAIKQVTGGVQQQKQAENAPAPTVAAGAGQQVPGSTYSAIPEMIMPLWHQNTSMDINMYVSPSFAMPALSQMPRDTLVLEERNFHYGDWSDKRQVHTTIAIPQSVQENGTLWAHIYISQSGSVMDPTLPGYDSFKAYRVTRPLTNYLAKKKVHKTRNLLDSSDAQEQVDDEPSGPVISNYYHPNFTLSIIPNIGTPVYPQMHPAMRQFVSLEATNARDDSGKNAWYYPVLYLNTFWQLRSQMTELNSTVTEMPLNLDLQTDPNWKFSIMASMDEGMKENARKIARGETTPGGGDGSELEMIKEVLLDTNMYLLGITGFVSILHMIFEMLAFKNDVSHWRKKKDNIGTSVRTILANVFMQSVIFLYLMDNNENTSWMILFGQGMGIAIEAWKVTKAVDVRVRPAPQGSLIPYRVVFEDKHKLSDTEKKTQEYDEIAFRYLYMVAVPLLLAYAGYSLVYETHKSWYSFIIATLVGSVYAYGFLMMVPSLYINYRLKSVAHMPAKAMTYKFLNTFIDDLFAFTIKMPTLHRLATLRDDVIFFVYLYQAWAYKVDHTRVNEFGQGGDDEEVEEKKGAQPLKSAPEEDASSVKTEVSSSGAQSKAGASRKRK
ncbi:cleft lip and palate transmembrane 1 [Aureobasidium sp. EXF-10728]|nr:cleft lip and palate transmembrane 1 [Aureobasidium sp. EXF-10728]